ncbi:MAG: sulfatase [Phycisphaerales bacterium]|nr:sulfatase [Phycisphaerales bacterium]
MILSICLLLCTLAAPADTASPSPDVVMIVVDDMAWADPGFMPGGALDTPHMDALAQRGMVFTQATSNGPNCAPSRACMITGQWSPRHGIHTVGSAKRGKAQNRRMEPPKNGLWLKPAARTMAEHLGEAGYRTGHAGKWHLGKDPKDQGFDFNVGGNKAGHPKSYFSPYRNDDLVDGPAGESLTDRLTDEAIGFLDAEDERPAFLHMSYYAVHTPLQATEEEIAALRSNHPEWDKRQATYAAMVQRVDRNIGRLLEHVDENDVVIFCSDNGGQPHIGNISPLRGSKGMLYEGGIRVPLVIAGPGTSAGQSDLPVTLLDLAPTVYDMVDVSYEHDSLDGDSLVPVLSGQDHSLESRSHYWHFPAYLEAGGKSGPWRTTPAGAIRHGRWKLIEYFEDGRLELYDLETDPGESRNQADDEPAVRDRLHELLRDWRQSVNAPMPTPLPIDPQ